MDAFSQILSGVKLDGAVYFTAEFSAPWGYTSPPPGTLAATLAPEAEHLVLYHLVIEGGCHVELVDGPSLHRREVTDEGVICQQRGAARNLLSE